MSDREQRNAQQREYRARHRDQINAKQRASYEANREKMVLRARKYRGQENPVALAQRRARYAERAKSDPDFKARQLEAGRKRYAGNRVVLSERSRLAGLAARARLRAEMVQAYGSCCACCGEAEPIFLTLDHANGDGSQHRREMGGGRGGAQMRIIRELRRRGWPADGFRLLCFNCQFGTRRPDGCPHAVLG